MSTETLRVATRRRLLDMIQAATTDDTGVFYALPAEWHQRSIVFFGDITGSMEPRVLKARQRREDSFSIEVTIQVAPGGFTTYDDDHANDPGSHQPADEACEALIQIIDEALAVSGGARLVHDGSPLDGGLTAALQTVNGPNPRLIQDGPGSEATLTIAVTSHLR